MHKQLLTVNLPNDNFFKTVVFAVGASKKFKIASGIVTGKNEERNREIPRKFLKSPKVNVASIGEETRMICGDNKLPAQKRYADADQRYRRRHCFFQSIFPLYVYF
jgi:hypothetical protein